MRAIEIRPGSVKGRKITHHAIARLQQQETDALAMNPLDANGNPLPGTFMEWAVGKQGEMMRPNSGKLMLPGAKIVWDIHYSNGGEDITDTVELGVYFYPKGQEPKFRQVLHLMGGTNGSGSGGSALGSGVDIPPNTVKATVGYFLLRENGRVESYQPHMHLRGKAMAMEAILPNGQIQVLSHVADFNFNWHNTYVYKETAAPLLPKGTLIKVTAWHDNTTAQQGQPRSERVGRLRRSHRRRNGARVGQRDLHERRRLPRRHRRAPQDAADGDDHLAAAVASHQCASTVLPPRPSWSRRFSLSAVNGQQPRAEPFRRACSSSRSAPPAKRSIRPSKALDR